MKASELKILSVDDEYVARLFVVNRDQYDVMKMYHMDFPAQTYKSIAHLLNIPIGTVRSRLNRARLQVIKWREIDEKVKANIESARGNPESVQAADDEQVQRLVRGLAEEA